MLKHYVEFCYVGIHKPITYALPVNTRNPQIVSVPENAIGFRFFDRTEVIHCGEPLKGDNKNYSPWYYIKEHFEIINQGGKSNSSKEELPKSIRTRCGTLVIELGPFDTII